MFESTGLSALKRPDRGIGKTVHTARFLFVYLLGSFTKKCVGIFFKHENNDLGLFNSRLFA